LPEKEKFDIVHMYLLIEGFTQTPRYT